MKRRYFLLLAGGIVTSGLSGCAWWDGLTMRSQSPEELPKEEDTRAHVIGDFASATNMQPACVEAVGLVTGLHGTGSDPIPSPERDALLDEMRKRDVSNPNGILASGNVSLVMMYGILRPGIQKGDRFDVDIRVPTQSETTSLRGGFLLQTWLTETAKLGGQIRKGDELATVQGPVMVDPTADPKTNRVALCRGRILGGGVTLKSRPLGLVLTPEHKDVRTSARIATAINRRFHTFLNGVKDGMAKALNDEYIELKLHPRYKDNVGRYMQVVRSIAITETAPERTKRIAVLQTQLFDPPTSAGAALQLEAMGNEGAETLLKGIKSSDAEVRFYSAEALAYLDRREAAEPLGQIARDQPAFRVFALTALSTMQDFAAADQLRSLLAMPSAETRYGAFRALWTMNKNDPMVKGEVLGGEFRYHLLDVSGEPMVHVTHTRLAEVVLFGPNQQLLTPLAVNAGTSIMVTSQGGDEVTIAKFSSSEGDQKRTVSRRVDDVIRAIVELGGAYPDVVQALQEAKNSGALPSRFEVDALPEAGREYDRVVEDEAPAGKQADGKEGCEHAAKTTAASAAPELFSQKTSKVSSLEGKTRGNSDGESADDDDSAAKKPAKKGFFGRMFGSKAE